MIQTLSAGVSRRLARSIPFRPHRLALDRPVVAFTFDDFPFSAAENAAPVLEDNDMAGTFYFADGLAGRHENGQLIAGPEVAMVLGARGHEIGGHTRSHLDVQATDIHRLRADILANGAAIATLTGQYPASFAYPFGIVSLRSKQVLMHHYAGLRGIMPGINRGWTDLAHLHAHELYDATSSLACINALLDDLERHGGWLIFYTHDVRADPSSIGCSPGYFARVAALVRRRGILVEPVAGTLARIGAHPPFARGGQ
jgi:peptidoglycan/xylan/chitin deacetylase (PgdA/CDA1 family)